MLNATARIESLTKGKSAPLELLEIEHKFNSNNFTKVATHYGEAFKLYQEGKFSEAEQKFRALAVSDKPSEAMANRCVALKAKHPEDWQGIYKMDTK